MAEAVEMPALGESVTEGTVTQWLKQVGDEVAVDEPLLEVSTDKVDTEIPSPVAGVLLEILAEEDDTVEVGAVLCKIGDSDEQGADEGGEEAASNDAEAEDDAPAEGEDEASDDESAADDADQQPADGPASGGGEGEKVTMPALGESVTEGTVTQWLKSEGDSVEVDEPLLEVSTDKVDTEIPSPVAGTLQKILAQEDDTVEVGEALCIIGDGASALSGEDEPSGEEEKEQAPAKAADDAPPPPPAADEKPAAAASPAEAEDEDEAEDDEPEATSPSEDERTTNAPEEDEPVPTGSKPTRAAKPGQVYVTPIVRKLAKEKGVDLEGLTGSGVGGRIRREDVLEAAKKAEASKQDSASQASKPQRKPIEPSPLRGKTEKMSRLRKVIASRMVESLQTSAQLTTVIEVDVTRIAKLRAAAKDGFQQREGTKLTFLPFFVKAATEALKGHPKVNATIKGDEVEYRDVENIGIAVDTERGLLVPVVKNAGDLTIPGIAKAINDLAARTRESKVTPDELSGGTFTITNTGSGGALFDTPIVNQPEVAILGVGTIVKRPMVQRDADGNDVIAIRSMVYLALSYDHRLIDGADAARYLMDVKARLEAGEFDAEVGL